MTASATKHIAPMQAASEQINPFRARQMKAAECFRGVQNGYVRGSAMGRCHIR